MYHRVISSGPHGSIDINVAIVGGGIIGVIAALGLQRRGMRVTIYERARTWHKTGVGFAFTSAARDCMKALDPCILDALLRVGEENKHDFNRWWDGFSPKTKAEAESEDNSLLFQVPARDAAYIGCLRSHLQLEMATQLPEGVAQFGKQLESCFDNEGSGKVVLRFVDGETAEADLVIGCDGINSTVRKILLGLDSASAYPGYTHIVAYRTVVPVASVSSALGQDKSNTACMHLGPDAVVVSYPVNKGLLLNISILVHDPNEWPDAEKTTASATRDEVKAVVKDWGPHVRQLVDLLPETLTKWAIFDTGDNPAPTYARGRICIAGDAAHASSPPLGAGACMGVEDALVLAETLTTALKAGATPDKRAAISTALQAYSSVRMERSQWLVQASREAGNIYQWRHPVAGREAAKCEAAYKPLARKVWDFSVDEMIGDARATCQNMLSGAR
ncbi:hypothetical protein F4808DRAFT_452250 [Astrocystis sublimbata]|nr:hypothetical protein F4808DRAFT_452250 [Astrocystis sublimbata]